MSRYKIVKQYSGKGTQYQVQWYEVRQKGILGWKRWFGGREFPISGKSREEVEKKLAEIILSGE